MQIILFAKRGGPGMLAIVMVFEIISILPMIPTPHLFVRPSKLAITKNSMS